MLDEESHVDRTVERIEEQVQIDITAEFTTADAAFQSGVGFVAAWPQKTVTEGGDQILIALSGSQNCRHNAASLAAKYLDQLTHLAAHVGVYGAGVGKMKTTGNAVGEGVGDQGTLVRPPTIHGRFSNLGSFRDFFNGEAGKAGFTEKLQGCLQYGEAGLFATGTTGRTLSVPVFAV